ncbi:MAG: aminopeptidase P family protein [Chloroflexota bacterium]
MTSGNDFFADRLRRVQKVFDRERLDTVFIAPSADLAYLTGYGGRPSERPTLLAVGGDEVPLLLVPMLEEPRTSALRGVRVVAYSETDNPYDVLARSLGTHLPATAGVSGQMWSSLLLNLQRQFSRASFVDASPLVGQLRMRKSPDEVKSLSRAGALADKAFEAITSMPFSGKSERRIANDIRVILMDVGLSVGAMNPIVASGINSSSPHHLSGDREIRNGDAIVLDFGGTVDGYYADITRTIHVGTPDKRFSHTYEIVKTAQQTGVDSVRPGVTADFVDTSVREIIHAGGCGHFFTHRTGHGVGLDGHEEPYIVAGSQVPLEENMTFSIEPGIYITNDFGIRIEDIVVLEEHGARRLNRAPHDLVIVT